MVLSPLRISPLNVCCDFFWFKKNTRIWEAVVHSCRIARTFSEEYGVWSFLLQTLGLEIYPDGKMCSSDCALFNENSHSWEAESELQPSQIFAWRVFTEDFCIVWQFGWWPFDTHIYIYVLFENILEHNMAHTPLIEDQWISLLQIRYFTQLYFVLQLKLSARRKIIQIITSLFNIDALNSFFWSLISFVLHFSSKDRISFQSRLTVVWFLLTEKFSNEAGLLPNPDSRTSYADSKNSKRHGAENNSWNRVTRNSKQKELITPLSCVLKLQYFRTTVLSFLYTLM